MLHHRVVLLALMQPFLTPRWIAFRPIAFSKNAIVPTRAHECSFAALAQVAAGSWDYSRVHFCPSKWVRIDIPAHFLQPISDILITFDRKPEHHGRAFRYEDVNMIAKRCAK